MTDNRNDEIPAAIAESIASWRRIMGGRAAHTSAREILQRATTDLSSAAVIGKTNHPASAGIVHQAVADALNDLAVVGGVDPDGAQRIIAEAWGKQATVASPQPAGTSDWWRSKLIDMRDLCAKTFPATKYVVPGIFPEGVTLLASRPKLGKSWLLLQVGSAVAGGQTVLVGSDNPLHGDVLYLALEDNERRLQTRLTKYFGPRPECWPARLTPVIEWKRLDEGGLDGMEAWCKSVEKPALIMVDTLARVRPPKRNGETDYAADYRAFSGLQQLAGALHVAIIVAHHDRKMDADDAFDTVSGTLGLTGSVDTIALIKRLASGTTLHVRGRDLNDEVEKALSFDRETCRWSILGEAADVQRSSERARVLATLRDVAIEGLSVGEIKLDADMRSRDAADKLLQRMAKAGEIERRGRGRYVLPGTPLSKPPSEASESPKRRQTIDGKGVIRASDTSDTSDGGAKGSDGEARLGQASANVVRLAPRNMQWRGEKLYARKKFDGRARLETLGTGDIELAKKRLPAVLKRWEAEAYEAKHGCAADKSERR